MGTITEGAHCVSESLTLSLSHDSVILHEDNGYICRKLESGAPKNGFDEMAMLTEQGKLWPYPIDNEWRFDECNVISPICFKVAPCHSLSPLSITGTILRARLPGEPT